MEPRKPKSKPAPTPPLDVEGGLDPAKAPPAPDAPDSMLGQGGRDRGEDSREGGMIGEG